MDTLRADGAGIEARAAVAALGLREPVGDRPRVAAIMIASADGRATVGGKSGPLGHPEDRALLRALRAAADAVLVGPSTLKAERYAKLVDPEDADARAAAGLARHPLVATITRGGRLAPGDAPVFSEPGTPSAVYSEGPIPAFDAAAGDVSVHALGEGGAGPGAVLRHLREHHGVTGVACEGGPSLLRALAAAGLVDDLLLTLAPLLVAGDGPTPLAGDALHPPAGLALRDVRRAGDHLFLHYARSD